MRIAHIISKRRFEHWPSYDLVYEWEDEFSKQLSIPICSQSRLLRHFIANDYPHVFNLYYHPLQFSQRYLYFDMNTRRNDLTALNSSRIIPIVIDFFVDKHSLESFYARYSHHPLIFITSKEAYSFLLRNNCPLRIEHLPLSLPDKYPILPQSELIKKDIDVLLAGRQNKVLFNFLREYQVSHPNLLVVSQSNDNSFHYVSNTGASYGNIDTRSTYLQLLRRSKCILYSTPGIDGGEQRTKGFNQVTPKFLEAIMAGCHVIARYPQNEDTDFYQLNLFSPSVDSFDLFRQLLDKALSTCPDMLLYSEYLSRHYTSQAIQRFKEIIQYY